MLMSERWILKALPDENMHYNAGRAFMQGSDIWGALDPCTIRTLPSQPTPADFQSVSRNIRIVVLTRWHCVDVRELDYAAWLRSVFWDGLISGVSDGGSMVFWEDTWIQGVTTRELIVFDKLKSILSTPSLANDLIDVSAVNWVSKITIHCMKDNNVNFHKVFSMLYHYRIKAKFCHLPPR